IEDFVNEKIMSFFKEDHKKVKEEFVAGHIESLKEFSKVDRFSLGVFVDEVLKSCKKINASDLENVVQIFLKLEESKSGYDIIKRLAECSPDDIDNWHEIMSNWTSNQAK